MSDLDHPEMSSEDHEHLGRSLRLRAGELVVAIDGHGGWRPCRWTANGELDIEGSVATEPPARPPITVAFSLLKGDNNELVVQKLTELGVDRIVPLLAERTVVKWDPSKTVRNLERLRRVAYDAAMQSRRVRLAEVVEPVTVAEAVASGIVLAAPDGECPSLEWPSLAVGPEGGWSQEELAMGSKTVTLGGTILRSETAAVTAGSLLCGLRRGLVLPATGTAGTWVTREPRENL